MRAGAIQRGSLGSNDPFDGSLQVRIERRGDRMRSAGTSQREDPLDEVWRNERRRFALKRESFVQRVAKAIWGQRARKAHLDDDSLLSLPRSTDVPIRIEPGWALRERSEKRCLRWRQERCIVTEVRAARAVGA